MTAATIAQIALVVVSLATVGAYACRLGALQPGRHRAGIIALHLVLGWLAVWSAYTWAASPQPLGLPALAVSIAWIVATLPDWRAGVPSTVRRPDAPPSAIHIDPLSR